MNPKKILLYIVLFASPLCAQDLMVIPQIKFVRFSPVYQYWNYAKDANFSQTAFPVYAYSNINNQASVNLRTSQANVSGDGLTNLIGLTDTQLGFNYHVQDWNVVFSLGLNVPSGKKELTFTEYATSYLISLNYFNLQVPNYGQGFNAAPGVNWAFKVNDQFVLGLSAQFQYKGGFKPIEGMDAPYEPGNEISVSAGGDFNLSDTQIISTDVMYTHYSSDSYDGNEIFASGDKIVVNLLYQQYLDFNKLTFYFRYRSKAKNSVPDLTGALVQESAKSIPDHFELRGQFRQRFTSRFHMNYNLQYRWFQSTPAWSGAYLAGLGFTPEFRMSPRLTLSSRLMYNIGSFDNDTSLSGAVISAGMLYYF